MSTTDAGSSDIRAATVELEIPINAPREKVWSIHLNEVHAWWPADFRLAANPERITLEPFAGGRLFEEGRDGASLLWARVMAIDPPNSIQFRGDIAPPWGGPAVSYLWLQFESPTPDTTLLKLTDTILGRIPEQALASMDEGWKLIYDGGLRAYVEQGAGA